TRRSTAGKSRNGSTASAGKRRGVRSGATSDRLSRTRSGRPFWLLFHGSDMRRVSSGIGAWPRSPRARRRQRQPLEALRTARNLSWNSMDVELLTNGQEDQQQQRRPGPADASPRTTRGFSHSQTLGLAGAETAPKTRGSSSRPTLNGDHVNGPSNS